MGIDLIRSRLAAGTLLSEFTLERYGDPDDIIDSLRDELNIETKIIQTADGPGRAWYVPVNSRASVSCRSGTEDS